VAKVIETTIFIEPKGKARPRTMTLKKGKNAGRVIAYTPRDTVKSEDQIRRHLGDLLVKFERDIPLRLSVTFWHQRPASCPKSRIFPTVKPDWDNEAKLVCDASNKYIWQDDAQIVTALIRKRYCIPGQVPRIEIYLTEEKA
jgi:Holliday junction resolvase RusA-like endonuclease